jgi:hypothetical protein
MSYIKNTNEFIRNLQLNLACYTRKLQLCYEKYRRLEVIGLVSTPV